MLTRLSIAQKAVLSAMLSLATLGVAQGVLWSIGWPLPLALGVPLVLACVVAWLWTHFVVEYRIREFAGALRRVAAGQFDTRIPPAPDPELRVIEDAFYSMARTLDASMRELKHADTQRRRLFADLAHELATPTSTLMGIAEALASEPAGEERDSLLAHLDHEGARLERLVNDLRDLAHLDDPDFRLDPVATDLGRLVEQAAAWTTTQNARGVEIRCATLSLTVNADALRLDQAVRNLLGNALRYTPPGGVIAIAVESHGDRAHIVVDDGGAGVPDEVLPRLGERLLRLDPSRSRTTGGHGLGLSIVSAIVARHGGTLSFGRSPLGGLRASIDLPAQAR